MICNHNQYLEPDKITSMDPRQPLLTNQNGVPTEGSEEASSIDPSAVLNALRRSWWWALPLGLCLAAGAAVGGWMLMVPKYSASAFLRIDADDSPLIFETADRVSGRVSYDLYQNTQAQMMRTPFVLNAAIRDEEIAKLWVLREQPDPVGWLQENVRVAFPGKGEIMQVSLDTKSPSDCVKLVNAVVDAYMKEVVIDERNERVRRLETLRRAHVEKEGEIRQKQGELRQLASALGTGDKESLTVAQQTALQQFGVMQEKLTEIQFELMRAEGELQIAQQAMPLHAADQAGDVVTVNDSAVSIEGEGVDAESDTGLDLSLATTTPEVRRLEREIADLELSLETALESYGANHPSAKSVSRQLAVRRNLMQRRIADGQFVPGQGMPQMHVAALKSRVDVLKHQEQALQQNVDKLDTETRQLGRSSIDIELMRTELTSAEDILQRIGAEIERTSIEMSPKSRIDVISPAETATPPEPKKRIAVAGALGMVGLCLPFAIGIFWDLQRKNVNDAESASTALAVSTLGTIPKITGGPMKLRQRMEGDRVDQQQALLADSLDAVAGMILHDAGRSGRQVFMTTSALAGEGKSTVACLLAESLARSGKSVALVDFDFRRPSIDRYLDLDPAPGVAEVLHDKVQLDEALQQVESPRMSVLTAGLETASLYERSSSTALSDLFERLRQRFDLVIVDACPVLPVVDARIIGTYCDSALLTLVRDTSRIPAASQACEMLRAYGIPVLGTIVIGARSSFYSSAYGYERLGVNKRLAPK